MLTIKYEFTFKKDYKRVVKRGYDTRLLEKVIELLANGIRLPKEYRDHSLSGEYSGGNKIKKALLILLAAAAVQTAAFAADDITVLVDGTAVELTETTPLIEEKAIRLIRR